MKKLFLISLIIPAFIAVYGQNPFVTIIFRFQQAPVGRVNVKNEGFIVKSFTEIISNKDYLFTYSGVMVHHKIDTLCFVDKNNKEMRIISQNDRKSDTHFGRIYLNIPGFKPGKYVVKLKELFRDDKGEHYTAIKKFTWKTPIDRYTYNPKENTDAPFAQLQLKHPLLAPSDTLAFLLNGELMNDGACEAKLFFEIFKVTTGSVSPVLVFPNFRPLLCGTGRQLFRNTRVDIPSLYAKDHYYGVKPIVLDTGKYVFRFHEYGKQNGYVYSDTVYYNTILKTDKSKYSQSDSIHISFKAKEGFGFPVKRCGTSTTYHIDLEKYDEQQKMWQTIGEVLPAPNCLAIYESITTTTSSLEMNVPIPTRIYRLKYPGKFRLSTVVYESDYTSNKINCVQKMIYSDEFLIE